MSSSPRKVSGPLLLGIEPGNPSFTKSLSGEKGRSHRPGFHKVLFSFSPLCKRLEELEFLLFFLLLSSFIRWKDMACPPTFDQRVRSAFLCGFFIRRAFSLSFPSQARKNRYRATPLRCARLVFFFLSPDRITGTDFPPLLPSFARWRKTNRNLRGPVRGLCQDLQQ